MKLNSTRCDKSDFRIEFVTLELSILEEIKSITLSYENNYQLMPPCARFGIGFGFFGSGRVRVQFRGSDSGSGRVRVQV